jgi:hypothetical protein
VQLFKWRGSSEHGGRRCMHLTVPLMMGHHSAPCARVHLPPRAGPPPARLPLEHAPGLLLASLEESHARRTRALCLLSCCARSTRQPLALLLPYSTRRATAHRPTTTSPASVHPQVSVRRPPHMRRGADGLLVVVAVKRLVAKSAGRSRTPPRPHATSDRQNRRPREGR